MMGYNVVILDSSALLPAIRRPSVGEIGPFKTIREAAKHPQYRKAFAVIERNRDGKRAPIADVSQYVDGLIGADEIDWQ